MHGYSVHVDFQEYDPSKDEPGSADEEGSGGEEEEEGGRRQEQAKGSGEGGSLSTNYYQQKYKHILGGLECAKESAVKMEPNKKFGYGKTAEKNL